MGTRALDLERWLPADQHTDAELALRHRLLAEQRDVVFGALPGSEDAATEACELVTAYLAAHGRPHLAKAEENPLAAAGMLVQEDLCLMIRHADGWRLDAGILCFPTLWLLADKLGRINAEVHRPVPHFEAELRARVDGF